MNAFQAVRATVHDFLDHTYAVASRELPQLTITINTDPSRQAFGDLSTNAPLALAKVLKKNPAHLAQEISQGLSHPYIDRVEVAGAGFINIFLTPQGFADTAKELATSQETFFKLAPSAAQTRYSVEFVSANPTGPLHVGHGRGGIIGDVLSRTLKFLGYPVTAEFYINDAGAQMEKLGQSLYARVQEQLGTPTAIPENGYHGEYLIELAQQCIAQEGPAVVQKPIGFFTQYAEQHLLKNIKHTLSLYGIEFDRWFSERTLHESGAIDRAVQDLTHKGFIYEQDGALWLASTRFGDDKDRVVKRAQDGNHAYTYVAADIAYLLEKLTRADKLVMVLGQDHHSYVTRLKAILSAAGHNPDCLTVILYQLVTLKNDGQAVRLSKRAGRIVGLADIIDEVGPDVARFFYLNRKADAHLDFDLSLALKHTDDNPVYYIQYAYVRLQSLLAKSAQTYQDLTVQDLEHLSATEHGLIKKVTELSDVLRDVSRHYQTHQVSYYAYELAHMVHTYYAQNRILGTADAQLTRARLQLANQLVLTFRVIFNILGMTAPDRM